MRMSNKKGVSPLIATVLLIAFAVALGAIVMNWGRTYIDETQDFAKESSEGLVTCSSAVSLKIEILKARVTIDNDEVTEVNLSLENKGGLDLPQFVVKLYDSNSGEGIAFVQNETFLQYRTKKFDFSGDSENYNVSFEINEAGDILENVTQISVIPFIDVDNKEDHQGCENLETKVTIDDDEFDYVVDNS